MTQESCQCPSPYNSLPRPLGHLADKKWSAPIHLVPTQTSLSVSSVPPVRGSAAQPSAFLLPNWCSQLAASHDWQAAPALSRVALQALFTPVKCAAVTSESQLRRKLSDFAPCVLHQACHPAPFAILASRSSSRRTLPSLTCITFISCSIWGLGGGFVTKSVGFT